VIRFLLGLGLAAGFLTLTAPPSRQTSQVGRTQQLAPDVYFHEGDISKGHCNNAWVVFRDYVLVVDANYPSGAREVLARIRETTTKPVRFAFDTHHHGDHAYGNQVWVEQGATAVAHTGVLDELRRLETGLFGSAPGRWEGEAKNRPDLRESRLSPPTVLFPDTLVFDDGVQRVELRHLGPGHTKGDGVAWLPKARILFTGDAAVNGAFNFVGDGDTGAWIDSLDKARALGATVVGPGHGPLGTAAVLDDQRLFFVELRRLVAADVRGAVDGIRAELTKTPAIARYVGSGLAAQVAKVHLELGGTAPADDPDAALARLEHQARHGRD
jgi:glyoxylase-like metal-dependent hydrolase (beta-lactamase superfamily II)